MTWLVELTKNWFGLPTPVPMRALCRTVARVNLDGELAELDSKFRVKVTIYQGLPARAHTDLDTAVSWHEGDLEKTSSDQTFNSRHCLFVQRMRDCGFILMSKQHIEGPGDYSCCTAITTTCYWSWRDQLAMELHDAMAEQRWFNRLRNWMKWLWSKLERP